jgi:hypothetical protein
MISRFFSAAVIGAGVCLLSACDAQRTNGRYQFREDKRGRLERLDTMTGKVSAAEGDESGQVLPPDDPAPLEPFTPEDLAKITGNGSCKELPQTFEGRLYNGTGKVLRTVGIDITHKKFLSNEVIWKRSFVARDLYIRPLEAKTFVLLLAGVESSAQCDWTITNAFGSPWSPNPTWWDRLNQ